VAWPRPPQKPPLTPILGEKSYLGIFYLAACTIAGQAGSDKRVLEYSQEAAAKGGDARVSVLKAVVTQASFSHSRLCPLYLALLFQADEGPTAATKAYASQIDGLFRDNLYQRFTATRIKRVVCVRITWSCAQEFRSCGPPEGPRSPVTTCGGDLTLPAYKHEFMRLFALKWTVWTTKPTSTLTVSSQTLVFDDDF